MSKTDNSLIIEARSKRGGKVYFQPLNDHLRSRFAPTELQRLDPAISKLVNQVPGDAIPGHRIAYDLQTRRVEIIDPLHDPQNAELKEWIESKQMKIGAKSRVIKQVGDDFLPWMKRLVESGSAIVVRGAIPEGTPDPSPHPFGHKPVTETKLDDVLEGVKAIVGLMYAKMSPDERSRLDSLTHSAPA